MKNRIIILALFFSWGLSAAAQSVNLSLQQCKEMASVADPYLKNSYLDLLSAQSQKKEAFAEYFPKVSINSFGFWSYNPLIRLDAYSILGNDPWVGEVDNALKELNKEFGTPYEITMLDYGFTASLMVVQPLFVGGRIIKGNQLAKVGVQAAQNQYNIQVRQTNEQVEQSYWEIVALEQKMKTLDHLQELLESLQKDAQAAVDAGLTTDTDLLLVKIKKNELRSGKIELQGGIRLLKMKLFNSIGQKYSFLESLSDSTAPYVDSIRLSDDFRNLLSPENYYKSEEQMLQEMDEGKLLSLMVQAKELEKRMALGEVLPQVMLGASTGYSHITESQFNGTVFATISIPISDWGKASHKLKRLENQVQKAQNEQEYLQSMLLLQIRQLWLDLNICWDKMSVAAESVEMAKSSVEKQTNEYQAGLVSMSDLLTTQSSLFEAVEVYLNAQIEYSKALTAYLGRQ